MQESKNGSGRTDRGGKEPQRAFKRRVVAFQLEFSEELECLVGGVRVDLLRSKSTSA